VIIFKRARDHAIEHGYCGATLAQGHRKHTRNASTTTVPNNMDHFEVELIDNPYELRNVIPNVIRRIGRAMTTQPMT
jgi:hypothetical protein